MRAKVHVPCVQPRTHMSESCSPHRWPQAVAPVGWAGCCQTERSPEGMARGAQDDARRELLQMSESQLSDIARFCNRYPDIQMTHAVAGAEGLAAGEAVTVEVTLERALEGDLAPVDAPRSAPLRTSALPQIHLGSVLSLLSICHGGRHLPR